MSLVSLLMTTMFVLAWPAHRDTAQAAAVYVVAHDSSQQSGSGDVFGTLDVNTGAFHQISALTINQTIVGMGFGTDGQLYGLGLHASPTLATDLYRIDPTTGATTDLGPSNFFAAAAGSNGGLLFGIDVKTSQLYSLNPPSPAASLIAQLPFTSDGLLAVSPGGQLYATGNLDGSFYSVDATTGTSTLVGNTGQGAYLFAGSFVGPTLYGFNGADNAIVTIDPATAATTQVATAALPTGYAVFASAAAPAAVPEPTSLALGVIAGLSVLACGCEVRRR